MKTFQLSVKLVETSMDQSAAPPKNESSLEAWPLGKVYEQVLTCTKDRK